MEITKEFSFDSAHRLINARKDKKWNAETFGKCNSLHGHLFRLFITIKGRVNEDTGMIINFNDLKRIVNKSVIEKLDHKFINDIIPDVIPTCENLIEWIRGKLEASLPKYIILKKLVLYETPTSFATWKSNSL